MQTKVTLGLEDALRGIGAAQSEAEKDGRGMAMAVVDDNGDLIACQRMNGVPERVLRFAIRKAYTAAVMRRGTLDFKKDMDDHHRTLSDYGDPLFTTLQGGLPIVVAGQCVGGISVGGNQTQRDIDIANVALKAITEGAKK
jgi:glc operon protein GlcG